jgi:hypothetical protein
LDEELDCLTTPTLVSRYHYRMKDCSFDVWVSDEVAPWGLVKTQGKESSMLLTKVIRDAKDHSTGTPKKFNPMDMMQEMDKPGR